MAVVTGFDLSRGLHVQIGHCWGALIRCVAQRPSCELALCSQKKWFTHHQAGSRRDFRNLFRYVKTIADSR